MGPSLSPRARGSASPLALRLLRATAGWVIGAQGGRVLEETQETAEIIQRVAASGVGKAELTCCVRIPGQDGWGRRGQEVRTYQTMTRWLLVLADRLGELGVTRVVMEATSDSWKGAFDLLEAAGFGTWLVNARDIQAPPRPAQARHLDAVWLCELAERQLLRPHLCRHDRSGSCGR